MGRYHHAYDKRVHYAFVGIILETSLCYFSFNNWHEYLGNILARNPSKRAPLMQLKKLPKPTR